MENVATTRKQEMQESIVKLEGLSTQLRGALDDVAEVKRKVAAQGKVVLTQIKEMFAPLSTAIAERENDLTRKCEEIMQARQVRLELQIERLKQLESQIGYSTQFATSAMKEYTLDEYMTQSSMILSRLESLTSAFSKVELSPCTESPFEAIVNAPINSRDEDTVNYLCYPQTDRESGGLEGMMVHTLPQMKQSKSRLSSEGLESYPPTASLYPQPPCTPQFPYIHRPLSTPQHPYIHQPYYTPWPHTPSGHPIFPGPSTFPGSYTFPGPSTFPSTLISLPPHTS